MGLRKILTQVLNVLAGEEETSSVRHRQVTIEGITYWVKPLAREEIDRIEMFLTRWWVNLNRVNDLSEFTSDERDTPLGFQEYKKLGATTTQARILQQLHSSGLSLWTLRSYLVAKEEQRWQ